MNVKRKVCGRIRSWASVTYCSAGTFLEDLSKSAKILNQDSLSLG
jgi:hypothetical protein